MPILSSVETPDTIQEPDWEPEPEARAAPRRSAPSLWGMGERLTWMTGLVLALSAFTGWYSGEGEGVTVSVIGWHTGVLGKLVFLIGVLAILVVALRQWGFDLPAAVPESLVVIALGALSTIFVLVRAISIPDEFFFAGRGIGLWISLLASVALIGAGLLQASEEL
jgi:CubicO group peptidase (beta-lactamase class C family)